MAVEQQAAQAGKRLGRYRIERELGRGGMGIVYLARDEHLEKRVALKTTTIAQLASGEKKRSQRRERFIREVRALAQVNHENVVHVFDAGEQDDPDLGWLLFYAMEFVDGVTLAQLVHSQGAMEPTQAAAVCMQTARGLGAAHERGIVHRDVKPANIFIGRDRRALIGDFGICKIEGSTQITRRDQLVGTPNYLAPEQILGEAVTPATDVFALASLYYIITTLRPVRSKVDANSLLKSAKSNAPSERMLKETKIPEGLRRVFAKALDVHPSRRFQNGNELADALAEFASRVPVVAGGPPPSSPRASVEAKSPRQQSTQNLFSSRTSDAETPDQVEQAAAALLSDFQSQRQTPAVAAGSLKLPTANTESTAMFNLRKYEEEMGLSPAPSPELPVARAESTAIFQQDEYLMAADTQRLERPMAKPEDTVIFDRNSIKPPVKAPRPKKVAKDRPPLTKGRMRNIALSIVAASFLGLISAVTLYYLVTPPAREVPKPRLLEE